ncbi:MAG: HAD-IA family hydrolase [Gemmataceae bacterium]
MAILVERLHDRGTPVVVASNFDARLHTVLADHPVRRKLRGVLVSSEIGCRKPAEAFFRKTAAALETVIGDVLFVGDDRRNDYEGARAVGMQACLLNPEGDRAGSGRVGGRSVGALFSYVALCSARGKERTPRNRMTRFRFPLAEREGYIAKRPRRGSRAFA